MDQFVGRMLRRIHARNGISKGYRIPFFIQLMALDESFVLHWRLISPQLGPWGTPSHEISGQKRLLGDQDFLMWIMNSNSIRCQVHAARVMGEHRNSDTVSLTSSDLYCLKNLSEQRRLPFASCSRGKHLSPPGSLREYREGSAICRPCRALPVFSRTSQPSTSRVLSPAHNARLLTHIFLGISPCNLCFPVQNLASGWKRMIILNLVFVGGGWLVLLF